MLSHDDVEVDDSEVIVNPSLLRQSSSDSFGGALSHNKTSSVNILQNQSNFETVHDLFLQTIKVYYMHLFDFFFFRVMNQPLSISLILTIFHLETFLLSISIFFS